jgi:nucleoporin NUP42
MGQVHSYHIQLADARHYSLETMTKDFDVKGDMPSWPLSSYGPAKHEKNLLPSLDESFEELRVKAVTAMRNGNINEYVRCYL